MELAKNSFSPFDDNSDEFRLIQGARHVVDEGDIAAVTDALRSAWLTTGPLVDQFEREFAHAVGVEEAVALSSGTAALHAAMAAIGIKPGDEVIVPTLTFVATANCVLFQGGVPVFADVNPHTLLIDPKDVERKITVRTRAIIAMDYAGQPSDYRTLRQLADFHQLHLVSDACHSLGASYRGAKVGTLADVSIFSLHPAKAMTTGEGGVAVTRDRELAAFMRRFRNHGIDTDHRTREQTGMWRYEMLDLGYNYRITDLQCALGISQLKKLEAWIARRRNIAQRYDNAFTADSVIRPMRALADRQHARHLYPVRLRNPQTPGGRDQIFRDLRASGIGVNVHFFPVHLQPYYRRRFATAPGLCPEAEQAAHELLSLPLHAGMSDQDADYVINAVRKHVR